MVKSKKTSLSRKYLKIIGIVTIILAAITCIGAIIAILSIQNVDLSTIFTADQLASFRNANIDDNALRIIICVTIGISVFISILEGILLIRASKDPRKSVFLLVLLILSIISGIATLISGGVQNIGTNAGTIISLTIDVLAVMAVMSARKEVE